MVAGRTEGEGRQGDRAARDIDEVLRCRAEGLGAALTTPLTAAEPEAMRLLSIPDGYGVSALVAVGHPDPDPLPRTLSRAAVEAFTSRDTFDGPAFRARSQNG